LGQELHSDVGDTELKSLILEIPQEGAKIEFHLSVGMTSE